MAERPTLKSFGRTLFSRYLLLLFVKIRVLSSTVISLQPLHRIDSTERLFSGPLPTVFKGVNCEVEEFLKVDEVVFAQQLTLVEHEMQRNSPPTELLQRVFGNKQHLARDTPGISAIVDHFSRISQVATTLVVKTKKLADRVEVLRKLINIATVSHLSCI